MLRAVARLRAALAAFIIVALFAPVAACAASASAVSGATITVLSPIGAIAANKRKGAVAAPSGSISCISLYGTATAANCDITFALKSGAREVWVKPGGSDANTCLSFAQGCATYDRAFTVWQSGALPGDHLMLPEGSTLTDSIGGTCCWSFTNFSTTGATAQYPYAVLSYDPADPTNTAKYGRAVGSAMPVLQLTDTPTLQSPSGSAGYLAVQGLEIKGRSSQLAYRSDGLQFGAGLYNPRFIIFQNVRFNKSSATFTGAGNILFSKTSFINGSGIYAAPNSNGSTECRDLAFQDLIMVHNGWDIGASRYDTVANGSAQVFTHSFYIHAGCSNIFMDRIVSIDSSNEGITSRSGFIGSQFVSIDAPAGIGFSGFSTTLAEQPGGFFSQLDDAAVIGSSIIDSTHPAAGGLFFEGMLTGSYARNIALFDDPNSDNTVVSYNRKFDAQGEVPSFMLLDKISTWNFGYSNYGANAGAIGYIDSQFPTRQHLTLTNSVFQNTITPTTSYSSPTFTNETWTSTLGSSSATGNTSRSAAPAGYKTKNQILSALGFSSKAAFANTAAFRPDLPWAGAVLTQALPAMGLTPKYANVSPPSLTGITPPAYYPTALADISLSTLNFTRGTTSNALASGTSANFALSSSDLPAGFSLVGRLLLYDGSGSGAATPTIHILETSADTLGTHTTPFTLNISGSGSTTLGTLALSSTSYTRGSATSGSITGATTSSTLSTTGIPTGLTINSAARTWAWDGSGSGAASGTWTLTETLAGATNTPHANTISYSIAAAGGTTFSSGLSTNDWVLSNANLTANRTNNNNFHAIARGSAQKTSGSFTATVDAQPGGGLGVGFDDGTTSGTNPGNTATSIAYLQTGDIWYNGLQQSGLATYTAGDTITATLSGGVVTFKKNGVAVGTGINISGSLTNVYPLVYASTAGSVGTQFTASFSGW